MIKLTPDLLDNYPYSHYANTKTMQRGRAYYLDGRVWDIEVYNKRKAVCIVDGDTGEYTVTIEVNNKTGELIFDM